MVHVSQRVYFFFHGTIMGFFMGMKKLVPGSIQKRPRRLFSRALVHHGVYRGIIPCKKAARFRLVTYLNYNETQIIPEILSGVIGASWKMHELNGGSDLKIIYQYTTFPEATVSNYNVGAQRIRSGGVYGSYTVTIGFIISQQTELGGPHCRSASQFFLVGKQFVRGYSPITSSYIGVDTPFRVLGICVLGRGDEWMFSDVFGLCPHAYMNLATRTKRRIPG